MFAIPCLVILRRHTLLTLKNRMVWKKIWADYKMVLLMLVVCKCTVVCVSVVYCCVCFSRVPCFSRTTRRTFGGECTTPSMF